MTKEIMFKIEVQPPNKYLRAASCLLQGREKNIGLCRFIVKNTCIFAAKKAKSWSDLGARMVQPWYGLGAEKICLILK